MHAQKKFTRYMFKSCFIKHSQDLVIICSIRICIWLVIFSVRPRIAFFWLYPSLPRHSQYEELDWTGYFPYSDLCWIIYLVLFPLNSHKGNGKVIVEFGIFQVYCIRLGNSHIVTCLVIIISIYFHVSYRSICLCVSIPKSDFKVKNKQHRKSRLPGFLPIVYGTEGVEEV